jgi:hypothetical protein
MEADDGPCHVTTTSRSGHAPEDIVVHHVRELPVDQTTKRRGLPATTAARTILDLSETESYRTTRRALGEALYHRRTSLPQLREILAASPGRRAQKVLRRLLPTADATHSGVEDRFLPLILSAGLPKPLVNRRIAGFRIDFYWPAEKLAVEIDTWGSHGDHLSFEDDRRRSAALRRAGIEVLRFTDVQFEDEPNAVLVTIAVALKDRS